MRHNAGYSYVTDSQDGDNNWKQRSKGTLFLDLRLYVLVFVFIIYQPFGYLINFSMEEVSYCVINKCMW